MDLYLISHSQKSLYFILGTLRTYSQHHQYQLNVH
jgi:hypothetical protein